MSRTSWDVLGIAPTSDKAAIKKAYAKQLKHNKPDKNPAGFRRLRAAYEQALATRHHYQNLNINIHIANDEQVQDNSINADNLEDKGQQNVAITETTQSDIVGEQQVDAPQVGDHSDDAADCKHKTQKSAHDSSADTAQTSDTEANKRDTTADQILIEQATPLKVSKPPSLSQIHTQAPAAAYNNQADLPIQQDVIIDDAQQIDAWRAEWYAIVEQYINPQSDTSQKQYYAQADKVLRNCLSDQFKVLKSLSLDTRLDYEIALFVWFEAQPPLFVLSYRYASKFFDWNKYITAWDIKEYPWYLMRPVYDRYNQTNSFSDKEKFKSYLAYHYPLVHKVWNFDVDHPKIPLRLRLLTFLYTNQLLPLLQQLEALTYDLSSYHNLSHQYECIDTQYDWLNHPQFIDLKQYVTESFFNKQDLFSLIFISILLTAFWWIVTQAPWPALTFIHDTLGVYLVMLFGLGFWQLQLYLFTKPHRFVIDDYTPADKLIIYRTWRNVSFVIWLSSYIIYRGTDATTLLANMPEALDGTSIINPFTTSYFIAHIAGLSMLIATNAKNYTPLSIQMFWYMGLILFVFAVILQPLDFMTATDLSREFNSTSPVFWGLLVLPLIFDQLGAKLPRLRFILTMFSVWLTGAWVFFAILAFLGIIAVSIEVLSNLNIIATLITWILMLIFLVGYLVSHQNKAT